MREVLPFGGLAARRRAGRQLERSWATRYAALKKDERRVPARASPCPRSRSWRTSTTTASTSHEDADAPEHPPLDRRSRVGGALTWASGSQDDGGPTPVGSSGSAAGDRRSCRAAAATTSPTRACGRIPRVVACGRRRRRSVRHTFHRNGSVDAPSRNAPIDEIRFSVVKPSARQVAARPGGACLRARAMCCTRNVRWKPTNISQKCTLPEALVEEAAGELREPVVDRRRTARTPSRRTARSACGRRRSTCRCAWKSIGAAASMHAGEAAEQERQQEPEREQHRRRGTRCARPTSCRSS